MTFKITTERTSDYKRFTRSIEAASPTGEMSRGEVTADNYPMYFEAAALVRGATVEPFDQYQGPFIFVPNRGRFFLNSDDGCEWQWYDESNDTVSDSFLMGLDDYGPAETFADLVEHGGTPVDRA